MKKFLLIATMLLTFGFVNAQTNIRQGSSSYGNVIYNTDGKLPIAIS